MSSVRPLWLGYARGGSRASLDVGAPGSKVLLLGSKANELAALAAVSAKEAEASPVMLDLSGHLASHLSGHFDTYDYRSFLYDSFRLTAPEAWHSQLAAAAYSAALDLSSEEEAIINSAMQAVASEGTLLSPASVHDIMGKVEGFRGFYVDKLKGKLGSVHLLDAVEDQDFGRLSSGNVIVDFHEAPYPQAAELAAALFLAKLLTIGRFQGEHYRLVLLTDAHRVFKPPMHPAHSNRLLSSLLDWSAPLAASTEQPSSLAPLLLKSCPVAVYSSDAWHALSSRTSTALSGNFVINDSRSRQVQSFVPRRIPTKTAAYAPSHPGVHPNPELTRLILEEVERFPLSTPSSIVQYMAAEFFLPADVRAALSSLESQGALILEPKESGSGPRVFAYTLTERGRGLMQEMRR